MEVSIVIPLYKSLDVVEKTIEIICQIVDKNVIIELILINDGCSQDYTTLLKKYKSNEQFKLVYFRSFRNYGQYYATYAGLKRASYEKIITLDSDFFLIQDLAKIIVTGIENKNPVIYVQIDKEYNMLRHLLSRVFHLFVTAITMKKIDFIGSSFRILNKSVVKQYILSGTSPMFLDIFLIQNTHSFFVFHVNMNKEMKSSYRFLQFSILLSNLFFQKKRNINLKINSYKYYEI